MMLNVSCTGIIFYNCLELFKCCFGSDFEPLVLRRLLVIVTNGTSHLYLHQ